MATVDNGRTDAQIDSARQWAGDSRNAAERRSFVPALGPWLVIGRYESRHPPLPLIASDLRRNLVRHPDTAYSPRGMF